MIYIVLFFLFLSVLFYLIFGGADFGVGVLEFFSAKKNKRITKETAYRIIGPVWEANHIWLIICIVILWIAFPSYYNIIVTQLHIPITLLLVGIIGRGTAFVFRHYDAYKEESYQKLYDLIFQISSTITPLLIGITAGSLISGELIHPSLINDKSFSELYINTWLNPFSFLMGIFVLSIMALISSVFIYGEVNDQEKIYFRKKAIRSNVLAIVSGSLVFIEAFFNKRLFYEMMFNGWTFGVFIVVSLLVVPLWYFLIKKNKTVTRLILGIQIALILFVFASLAFPNLIFFKNGSMSILDNLPPQKVFDTLGWSLIIAALFVLPGLFHLFKTFGLLSLNK
ncbi:MAG: cytochrome d ubiquinol oxidase subunit II [Crocinitomicaceae bacterium]